MTLQQIRDTFHCDFTLDNLKKIITSNPKIADWYDPLVAVLPLYDITARWRLSSFIAQTAHESMAYTKLTENLMYSATGLQKTWPSRFPTYAIASAYAKKPEAIANKAYGGRYGNGPESSGDGWRYRGRGLIQVTFKDNYAACSHWLFNDDRLVENPDLLTDKEYALKSALWFWTTHKMNAYADRKDIKGQTLVINGGTTGLIERQAIFDKADKILKTAK